MHARRLAILVLAAGPIFGDAQAQELHRFPENIRTRWISLENIHGEKGQGGQENRGAKGHPFGTIKAGESMELAFIEGAGIIQRIWITVSERDPVMLRSLRLDMHWDGEERPAVAVPFGDFFNAVHGETVAFENELFSNPEGRSFNSFVPMPFRRSARLLLTNESDRDLARVFYDVNYALVDAHPADVLYFHAHWRREKPTTLGDDFEILPRISGQGRYLGTHMGVITDPAYGGHWWGEGEVKVFLDGDSASPTLVGTGTEDYIGTGWGQGTYVHRFQGCTLAGGDKRQWAFYRYHIPDPVYFETDIRVTIQQMGGAPKDQVLELVQRGVPLQPVTIDAGDRERFVRLFEHDPVPVLSDPSLPDGWTNYFREDDVSATVFFYLDQPAGVLPPLVPPTDRTAGL
jgi:hypothetical protein